MEISIFVALLALFTGGTNGYVYTCEEIKYKMLNSDFEVSTDFACLVAAGNTSTEDTFRIDPLKSVYATVGNVATSFMDIYNLTCIERPDEHSSWKIVADPTFNLNCTSAQFALIFTSSSTNINHDWINIDFRLKPAVVAELEEQVFAVPMWGQNLVMGQCLGDGNITMYTGAGRGEDEMRFPMKTWKCANLPTEFVSLGNVITITASKGAWLSLQYRWNCPPMGFSAPSDTDRLAIIASGLSDNPQNNPRFNNRADNKISIDLKHPGTIVATCSNCFFDPAFDGSIQLTNVEETQNFTSDGQITMDTDRYYEVYYKSAPVWPQQISTRNDNFVVELTFTVIKPTLPPPPPPTPAPGPEDPYCGCALNRKSSGAVGWNSQEIWLDIVFVLDTSEAMTEDDLYRAYILIPHILGNKGNGGGYLTTNIDSYFYSRVGLIAMSDKAEVVYNLNMTYTSSMKWYSVANGVASINIEDAFNAAQNMLKQGHIAHRSSARKIIYFVTDSDLIGSLPAADQFKANDGIIIVNNFIKAGEVRPGLFALASPGYYLTDAAFQQKEWLSLQLLCKANCYCRKEAGFTSYANYNKDPTKPASGGCFKAINSNYKFEDAKKKCTQLGSGLLASIHDKNKGTFVRKLLVDSNPEYPYFWIGYTRTDGRWKWEDQSTDSYTRWNRAFGEPSKNPVSNCAAVDSYDSIDQDFWYAVACNNAGPFVCEFLPCEAGNQIC